MHPPQQQRVVGHQQVGAPPACLVDDGEGRVEREEDTAYGLVEVTRDEPDAVPVRGALEGVERLERCDDVAKAEVGGQIVHVGPAGLEPTTPAV